MTDLQKEILRLKEAKNAMVLAHFYQDLELQQVADFVGDSFEMAKRAAAADAQLLIICGVKFMAESAKLLSPNKKVLLPRQDAGCIMADMIEPHHVRELRAAHPDAAVMCYVNSSAAVKAECDVCCTSSSALTIARALDAQKIIFVPDKNLGAYVASQVPEKEFVFFDGYCPIHHHITLETVEKVRAKLPDALLLVHPECRPDVVSAADFVGSTSQLINRVLQGDELTYVIGTETTVVELLRNNAPGKIIYALSPTMVCTNMRKTSVEDLHYALDKEVYEVSLPDSEAAGAQRALQAMLTLGAAPSTR